MNELKVEYLKDFLNRNHLKGSFGIIKSWPGLNVAEHENIQRVKNTAQIIGLTCYVLDEFGRLIEPVQENFDVQKLDFVIHLHFSSPKLYDAFSLVTLWNPPSFLYDLGYRACANNLLSHDDFLGCDSSWTSNHIVRLIKKSKVHKIPYLEFFNSLSGPILTPGLGEKKLFYIGVNWERVGGRKRRHSDLLKLLDKAKAVRIYGPEYLHGTRVWEGYDTYQKQIDFDGVSVIHEIAKCGIGLVISSDAHYRTEMISNRIFECAAAGVPVISERNQYLVDNFGDDLLYIDTYQDPKNTYHQILQHIEWINQNQEQALLKARNIQQKFLKKYDLTNNLVALYENFPARKEALRSLYAPISIAPNIHIICLNPLNSRKVIDLHLKSLGVQTFQEVDSIFVLNLSIKDDSLELYIQEEASRLGIRPPQVFYVNHVKDGSGSVLFGSIIEEVFSHIKNLENFVILGPTEYMFSDHLMSMIGIYERIAASDKQDELMTCICSDMVLSREAGDKFEHYVIRDADFRITEEFGIMEFGRFLFHVHEDIEFIKSQMRFFNFGLFRFLLSNSRIVFSDKMTITTSIECHYPDWLKDINLDLEFLNDLKSTRKTIDFDELQQSLECLEPRQLKVHKLSQENKTDILVSLVHSIPMPGFIRKILFGGYRKWLNKSKKDN